MSETFGEVRMARALRRILVIQVVATATAGLAAISAAGGPPSALIVQCGGLAIGLFGGWAASRLSTPRPVAAGVALGLSLAAAAITLLVGPGLEGVHRWVSAGPVLLHPMAVALPFVVWAYAAGGAGRLSTAAVAGLIILMALQPDGGALLGLSLALLGCALATRPVNVLRWVVAGLAMAATAWAWAQPDPLPAVPHVELVVGEALKAAPAVGLAAGALLLALPLSMLLAGRGSRSPLILGLVGLWAGQVLANLLGNYPAPVIGYSASLAIGWLASLGLAASEPPDGKGVESQPKRRSLIF